MDIAGIGTEIVECLRIRRMIEAHGEPFLRRVFTPAEILYCLSCRHSTEQFAARWAAKQAILKSIGQPGHPSVWMDLETETNPRGHTSVKFSGVLHEKVEVAGIQEIKLTMAYCRAYATATAIAFR